MENTGKLAGLTVFITGASRGIGKAIAIKVAKDGANVVIAARTTKPLPDMPDTIYTTLKEVTDVGGKGLACPMDICDENQINIAVEQTIEAFGGIDILINNAAFADINTIENIDINQYDLMCNTTLRGTYLMIKICLPYLKKSRNGHILNMSPPLNMNPFWFSTYLGFTIAKYGISMCVLGLYEKLRPYNVAVNALWPAVGIETTPLVKVLGKDLAHKIARKPEIMADATYALLVQDPKPTGHFFTDEEVLEKAGVLDFDQYLNTSECKEKLLPDFYLNIECKLGEWE